jgi:hypothetical protein
MCWWMHAIPTVFLWWIDFLRVQRVLCFMDCNVERVLFKMAVTPIWFAIKNAGQDKQRGSKQKTHRSTIGEHRFVVLLFVTFLVVWSVQVFAGSFWLVHIFFFWKNPLYVLFNFPHRYVFYWRCATLLHV